MKKQQIYHIDETTLSRWLKHNYSVGWQRGFWFGSIVSIVTLLIIYYTSRY